MECYWHHRDTSSIGTLEIGTRMKKGILVVVVACALTLAACAAPKSGVGADVSASIEQSSETDGRQVDSSIPSPESTVPGSQAGLDSFQVAMNPTLDYLTVVNAVPDAEGNYPHKYDFGGEFDRVLQGDLVYMADAITGEPTRLEKATALAFEQLRQAAFQDGLFIGLYSGYRTEAEQQWVYDYYGGNTARAGLSEHHTGLVVYWQVWWSAESGQEPMWYTVTEKDDATFARLYKALPDYGFILRYPKGKEAFTGVGYRPYEIRFVGSSKMAHEIMDAGLSLEEYVEQQASRSAE